MNLLIGHSATGKPTSTKNKMKAKRWKLSLTKIKRKTSPTSKINKKIQNLKPHPLTLNNLHFQSTTKLSITTMTMEIYLLAKNSWKPNNSKKVNLKVPKRKNNSKTTLKNLVNPLIIKLTKKSWILLIDLALETNLHKSLNKNTLKIKKIKTLPDFWTVMPKVMTKRKKILSSANGSANSKMLLETNKLPKKISLRSWLISSKSLWKKT